MPSDNPRARTAYALRREGLLLREIAEQLGYYNESAAAKAVARGQQLVARDNDEFTNDLLCVSQIAIKLGVSEYTVRRWIDIGSMRAIRLPSGRIRIPRNEIEAFTKRQTVSANRLLSAQEVAIILHCTPAYITGWIRRGRMEAVWLPNCTWGIPEHAVRDLLASNSHRARAARRRIDRRASTADHAF